MHLYGKRKENLPAGSNFLIPFFLHCLQQMMMKSCEGLFYVALTRAEKHLHISYVKYKADGKELEPSMFIAEILQTHELPIERIELPEEELMDFEVLNFTCSCS